MKNQTYTKKKKQNDPIYILPAFFFKSPDFKTYLCFVKVLVYAPRTLLPLLSTAFNLCVLLASILIKCITVLHAIFNSPSGTVLCIPFFSTLSSSSPTTICIHLIVASDCHLLSGVGSNTY